MKRYPLSTCLSDFSYEQIKKAGFEAIDYGVVHLQKETDLFSRDDASFHAYFEEEYRRIKAAGLRVGQIHAPFNAPPDRVSDEEFELFVKAVKRSFDVCTIMECRYLVIHPVIFPDWQENLARTKETNYRLFREYCGIAEQKDVYIAAENMPCRTVPYCDAPKMLELLENVRSPRLVVCLDTGHAHMSQEPGITLADMTRALGSHLKVLHVHDNDESYDQHLPPYFGTADWADFMQALEDIHYDGTFSFEAGARQPIPEEMQMPFLNYLHTIGEQLMKQ